MFSGTVPYFPTILPPYAISDHDLRPQPEHIQAELQSSHSIVMHDMSTLSPTRSSFSVSTESSSSISISTKLVSAKNNDVAKTHLTEHPDGFDTTLLAPPPHDTETITCTECHALASRVLHAWFTDPTKQHELQVAILHHFRHHDDVLRMEREFRKLGELMDRATKRGTQSNAPRHEARMENGEFDAFFDFDEYAATEHDAEAGMALSSPDHNIPITIEDPESECSFLTEVSDVSALKPDISIKHHLKQSTRSDVFANHAITFNDQVPRNKTVVEWLAGVQEVSSNQNFL